MPNETCSFEEPTGFFIIHILSGCISAPIYMLALWILIFKSSAHFKNYRNYLVVHILSDLLLEIHMGHIWKVTVVLPIPIMCSNSFTAEYAPIVFQLLPFCIIFTGISVVSLFVYRMEARFGKFQPYMWCDNCFFMNFDSKIFLVFYAFSSMATILCFYSAISALVITIKVLNSIKTQLSDKTAAIYRNFLRSLVLTALVHIVCILIPLLGFLLAISVMIRLSQLPYLPYILVMIIQEHDAATTVTMFLTNNLLRKTMKKMLSFKFEHNTNTYCFEGNL
ncbi:Protein CBG06528 [Caenorhabditis briggsae]|uniref:Protein CBG06528 n=1 Tax=Caenorhabditis briggsae TaxID=6238 RepID=A8X2G0_CAEBR|nr:Protein CBG06528 [Caenorhabditis briggsae]CAP26820.1 Protein CBG06528 [Caenorhabditis briggsae]